MAVNYRSLLRSRIDDAFTLDELRGLCFELGLDLDNILGGTKRAKIESLIVHFDERKQLLVLTTHLEQARPHIDWREPEIGPTLKQTSPYRGLFAFREVDAANFFGRELYAERLVEAVERQSFVALVGPSGSGKSSVVFAGLVPQLRKREQWLIISFRPANRPFYNLVTALVSLDDTLTSRTIRLDETQRLATALSREKDSLSLSDFLQDLLQEKEEKTQLLLIADQFEELYTLYPDVERRRQFLDALLAVSRVKGTTLLLTLRADFLGQALSYRPFADILEDHDIKLGPMTEDELYRTIAYPAKNVNVGFEAGLIERILDDIGHEPGNLPLLEFALTMLWQLQENSLLAHNAYDALGRVQGALTQYANQIYEGLLESEQALARHILTQLVQPGVGTEDIRRQATLTELSPASWPLVHRLADFRLVVTGQDESGQETVEVAHEALIQRWGRLREWLDADRSFRLWQERLRTASGQWDKNRDDEGVLLRGVFLGEATEWLGVQGEELSQLEKDFIYASLSYRKRQERRQSILLVIAITVMMIMAFLAIFSFRQVREVSQQSIVVANERDMRATAESDTAEQRDRAEKLSQIALAQQLAAQAQLLLKTGTTAHARQEGVLLAIESMKLASNGEASQSLRDGLSLFPRLVSDIPYRGNLRVIDLSVNGRWITGVSEDGKVSLWQTGSGEEVLQLREKSDVIIFATVSSDGRWLALGKTGNIVDVWDVVSKRQIVRLEHKSFSTPAIFSPDNRWLATLGEINVGLWNTGTGAELSISGRAAHVAFSPDSELLAALYYDGTVRIWNLASNEEIAQMTNDPQLSNLAFSPDGTELIAYQWYCESDFMTGLFMCNGKLKTWSAGGSDLSERSLTLTGNLGAISCRTGETWLALGNGSDTSVLSSFDGGEIARLTGLDTIEDVSQDGNWFATLSTNNIRVWTLTAAGERSWPVDPGRAIFSHDGKLVATTSSTISYNTVHIWEVSSGRELTRLEHETWGSIGGSGGFNNMLVTRSGETVHVWDVHGGQHLAALEHEELIWEAHISRDGNWIATETKDAVWIWDVQSNNKLALLEKDDSYHDVAFSPNSKLILVTDKDTAYIWQVPFTREPMPLAQDSRIDSIAFSYDSRNLALASQNIIRVLDVTTGQTVAEIELPGPTQAIAFDPSGSILATVTDSAVLVWDLLAEEELAFLASLDTVRNVVFSHDGQRILIIGSNMVRIWEFPSDRELFRIEYEDEIDVAAAAFSDTEHMLSLVSSDGWVRIQYWKPLDLVSEACKRLARNLTLEEWQHYFRWEPYEPTCPNLPTPS